MSVADEAWQEWADSGTWAADTRGAYTAFLAGYRRALLDAADELVSDGPKHPYNDDEQTRINAWCDGLHYAAREVRDRAAAVAPRETKDNAAQASLPEYHSQDCMDAHMLPCRCGASERSDA